MKLTETASGRSWRLLAEYNRVIAAYTERSDPRAALLRVAAAYEIRARQEDERVEARHSGATS
jgi:hypothetical protein